MVDRLFFPAAFVGLLADMPPVTAPAPARMAWLDTTWDRLRAAFSSAHGLEALRLANVINHERHTAFTSN